MYVQVCVHTCVRYMYAITSDCVHVITRKCVYVTCKYICTCIFVQYMYTYTLHVCTYIYVLYTYMYVVYAVTCSCCPACPLLMLSAVCFSAPCPDSSGLPNHAYNCLLFLCVAYNKLYLVRPWFTQFYHLICTHLAISRR